MKTPQPVLPYLNSLFTDSNFSAQSHFNMLTLNWSGWFRSKSKYLSNKENLNKRTSRKTSTFTSVEYFVESSIRQLFSTEPNVKKDVSKQLPPFYLTCWDIFTRIQLTSKKNKRCLKVQPSTDVCVSRYNQDLMRNQVV